MTHSAEYESFPLSSAIILIVPMCLLAATLTVSGCKPVGPDYSRPGYQAPAVYKEAGASTVVAPPNPPGTAIESSFGSG